MKKKLFIILTTISSFMSLTNVKAVGLYDTSYRTNTETYNVIKNPLVFGMTPKIFFLVLIGIILLISMIIYLIKRKEKRLILLMIPSFIALISSYILIRSCTCSFKLFYLKDILALLLIFITEKIFIKETKMSYKRPKMSNPIVLNSLFTFSSIYLVFSFFIVATNTFQKVLLVIEIILLILMYLYNIKRFNKLYKKHSKRRLEDE